jgi:hypothetical protein
MARSTKRSGEMHLLLGVSAVALAGTLLLGTMKKLSMQAQNDALPPADVAIEHAAPITLRVVTSTGRTKGIVELGRDGTESVKVSVPETWERREVRGAALDAAAGEPAAMGFRRWTIPAGATLSFWTPGSARVRVQNPSGVPVLVHAKRIHLDTNAVDEQTTLLKDAPLTLW